MSIGFYQNGDKKEKCEIIRRGKHNVRIKLMNEQKSRLVPSDTVEEWRLDQPCRIVPDLPLARFYKILRKLEGSQEDKFTKIQNHLDKNHKGVKEHEFLSQLFKRSLAQCELYDNRHDPFHDDGRGDPQAGGSFAVNLVAHWKENRTMTMRGAEHSYVDRELAPLRTPQSCNELGEAAEHSGGGGIDILLTRSDGENGAIPVVGEIKANTETVGPTFALIQSLMYVSQIATENQFSRLKETYSEKFSNLKVKPPRCNILVILESVEECRINDLKYAINLARQVNKKCIDTIPSIDFVIPQTEDNTLIPITMERLNSAQA